MMVWAAELILTYHCPYEAKIRHPLPMGTPRLAYPLYSIV